MPLVPRRTLFDTWLEPKCGLEKHPVAHLFGGPLAADFVTLTVDRVRVEPLQRGERLDQNLEARLGLFLNNKLVVSDPTDKRLERGPTLRQLLAPGLVIPKLHLTAGDILEGSISWDCMLYVSHWDGVKIILEGP